MAEGMKPIADLSFRVDRSAIDRAIQDLDELEAALMREVGDRPLWRWLGAASPADAADKLGVAVVAADDEGGDR